MKALNNAAINSVKNCNLELIAALLEQKSFEPLFSRSIILTLTNNNCLSNVIDKLVTYDNFNKILIDITKYSINNNVLELLLNSKFLDTKDKNLFQDVLINLIQNINENNLKEDNIILVLDKIEKIDDNVLFKCLKMGILKNLLVVLNRLIDFPLKENDIYTLFNIALDNGNIIAAIMVSNYDICDYIDDVRIINFLEEYIVSKNIDIDIYNNECDILYEYIRFEFNDLIRKILFTLINETEEENDQIIKNFVTKYNNYLNQEYVNDVISDIWSDIGADMYDPYY